MTELARVTTLEALAEALKHRRGSLGLSQLAAEEIAGMTSGHLAKIECGMKGLGKVSLPLMLGALKVEIVLMPTAAKHRKSAGATTLYTHTGKNHHVEIGARGGRARAAAMSKKKLRAIAQVGARARWKAERERKMKNG